MYSGPDRERVVLLDRETGGPLSIIGIKRELLKDGETIHLAATGDREAMVLEFRLTLLSGPTPTPVWCAWADDPVTADMCRRAFVHMQEPAYAGAEEKSRAWNIFLRAGVYI